MLAPMLLVRCYRRDIALATSGLLLGTSHASGSYLALDLQRDELGQRPRVRSHSDASGGRAGMLVCSCDAMPTYHNGQHRETAYAEEERGSDDLERRGICVQVPSLEQQAAAEHVERHAQRRVLVVQFTCATQW